MFCGILKVYIIWVKSGENKKILFRFIPELLFVLEKDDKLIGKTVKEKR